MTYKLFTHINQVLVIRVHGEFVVQGKGQELINSHRLVAEYNSVKETHFNIPIQL